MRVSVMVYVVLAFTMILSRNAANNTRVQRQAVAIGFLNRTASLWVATDGGAEPMESHEKLLLKTKSHQKILRHLSDLEGAVHIDNEATALQYVRLRTSPSTWYLWFSSPIVEIVNRKQAIRLPNYGLKKYTDSKAASGFMGILSDSEFNRGNFSKPETRKTPDGFVITRWLLTVTNSKLKVELLKEEVGFTGRYRDRILQIKDAPNLVGTRWQIPRFE